MQHGDSCYFVEIHNHKHWFGAKVCYVSVFCSNHIDKPYVDFILYIANLHNLTALLPLDIQLFRVVENVHIEVIYSITPVRSIVVAKLVAKLIIYVMSKLQLFSINY